MDAIVEPSAVPSSDRSPASHVRPRADGGDDLSSFVLGLDRGLLIKKLRLGRFHGEDILHDALTLLVESRDDVRPETRAAWLWGVMVRKRARLCREWALWARYADRIEAHFQAQTVPPPWPDADLLRLETLEAVLWLVEQVKPCRREVADRYLFEDVTLEEIAEESGEPFGTVRSKWDRARQDMRRALDREQTKLPAAPFFVHVAVLLVRLWVWLVGELPRGGESGKRGRIFGALVLCAVLPFGLVAHDPCDVLEPAEGSEMAMVAGFSGALWKPNLTTNAEREREQGSVSVGSPQDASKPADALPTSGNLARAKRPSEMGRLFLARATSALLSGNLTVARAALQHYKLACPDNPYPALYADIKDALRSP